MRTLGALSASLYTVKSGINVEKSNPLPIHDTPKLGFTWKMATSETLKKPILCLTGQVSKLVAWIQLRLDMHQLRPCVDQNKDVTNHSTRGQLDIPYIYQNMQKLFIHGIIQQMKGVIGLGILTKQQIAYLTLAAPPDFIRPLNRIFHLLEMKSFSGKGCR